MTKTDLMNVIPDHRAEKVAEIMAADKTNRLLDVIQKLEKRNVTDREFLAFILGVLLGVNIKEAENEQ